jgi:OCT family organic cation transporter-like MFS transporter 4/5
MATKAVRFEDILSLVGDKGRWQYTIFLLTWIEGILIGFHHLSSVFLGYTPSHWCKLGDLGLPEDWSLEQKQNFSIPRNSKDGLESCSVYDVASSVINSDFSTAVAQRSSDIVSCSSWDYATDMGWTTVSEWNLVCDRTALLSTVQGSYMGGVFVGCIFWGWASDKYGRRPSILIASVIQMVTSIIAAFSVNYIMFIFFRFLVAFSVSGVFECGFVLVTEIVAPELRTPFGIMTQFPFGIGASLLPLVAYFIKDWTSLQLSISIPCCLLISYYWTMPESPRWLVSKNRMKEALVILKSAAKSNGVTLESDDEILGMLNSLETKTCEVSRPSAGEKFREAFAEMEMLVATPNMRKRTINVYFSWLVVAMVYYGLSFNTKNIGADIYVSNFISGFAEVVACVVIIPALSRFGRVKIYSGTFLAGGVACILVAIILWVTEEGSVVWLIVSLAMTGKFLIAGTFALAYLYTAELFPTPVRNVAVGGASTFARIGSMSAPYIVDILGKISPGIPALIFGVSSMAAGFTTMALPETLNKQLPESVADVEGTNTDVEMGSAPVARAEDVTKLEE